RPGVPMAGAPPKQEAIVGQPGLRPAGRRSAPGPLVSFRPPAKACIGAVLMAQDRIRGVLSPVVTPFSEDLSPDAVRFIRHCKWLVSQRVGLAVFGTNSEANSLSSNERMALLEALVNAGVDPSRMMPGTGC